VVKCDQARQATDDNMTHAHCIPGVRLHAHLEYVIPTAFFLPQQWLCEHASVLRYTCLPAGLAVCATDLSIR
jgi:hypothetical protein